MKNYNQIIPKLSYLMIITIPAHSFSAPLRSASKMIENQEKQRSQYESVRRIVRNPTLASGLTSGARSINQTVDSLMETIFYNIMDQTQTFTANADLRLETNFSRIVNETSMGTYIISDQFRLGPMYQKEINRISNVGIHLGSDSHIFVRNIYHRTNALRAYERHNLPLWRSIFNQWFGILPFLANILPPSFNQEELYDPITYLKTPFLAPYDIDSAHARFLLVQLDSTEYQEESISHLTPFKRASVS